jgi:hypothetical protein
LEHAIHGAETNEELACRFNLSPNTLASALTLAVQWGKRIGVSDQDGKLLLSLPSAPRTDEQIRFSAELEERFFKLSKSKPDLLINGIALHLRYFNNAKKDVMFNGDEHKRDFQNYLSFVKALQIPSSQLEWQLRTESESPTFPEWSISSVKKLNVEHVRNIGSQSVQTRPNGYSNTVGLIFLSANGDRMGHFSASCAYLALIGQALKNQAASFIESHGITPEKPKKPKKG